MTHRASSRPWLAIAFALVFMQTLVTAPALADDAIRWVYLDVERRHTEETSHSLLLREFMRQSVTIAAREHFRLGTRDAALDEPRPADADRTLVLRPTIDIERGRFRMRVEAVDRDVEPLVVTGEIQSGEGGHVGGHDYMQIYLAGHYWALREIPRYFEEIGIEAEPIPVEPDAEASDEVERLLDRFDELAAYQAVRRTHELIREHGESRELLGQLIRGYSNLGQLSRYHFNAAEQVFYARAIIYASRLMERHGESPFAHQHRAYAYVMTGMDFAAFDSINRAHQLIAEAEDPIDSPAWFGLLDDYLHHRLRDLERHRSRDTIALASYLRLLLAEQSGTVERILPHIERMAELRPTCMRAVAKATEFRALGAHRWATRALPDQLAAAIDATRRSGSLPDAVDEALAAYDARNWPDVPTDSLARTLREAAEEDTLDPSYATMATLIEEAHFVQVFRRAGLLKHMLGVPADEFIQQAMPAIADHRYAPLVETLRYDINSEAATINSILDRVEFGDLPVSTMQLLEYHNTHPNLRWQLTVRVGRRLDFSIHDSTQYVALAELDIGLWHAGRIEYINPNVPLAAALRLEHDWEEVQDDLPELIERFGDRPVFMRGLAAGYMDEGRFDEAERVLRDYIDVSRELWGYARLTLIYERNGETEKWMEVVDRFLAEGVDAGLGKPSMAYRLARHLITLGRYREAHHYGQRAADSFSSWGLAVGSVTHELLGNWTRSEQLMRQNAQRYEGASFFWYYWCKRTGRGDLAAARDHARQHMVRLGSDPDWSQRYRRGVYYHLEGQHERALNDYMHLLEERSDLTVATLAAFTAQEAGDEERRDEALAHFRRDHLPAYSDFQRALFELVPAAVAAADDPDAFDFDLDAQAKRAATFAPSQQILFHYVVGRALAAKGKKEEARASLRRCAAPLGDPLISYVQTLAMAELHEAGIDPYAEARPQIEPPEHDDPEQLYVEARQLLPQVDTDTDAEAEVLRLLEEYVERTGNWRGLQRIATIHMDNGDYEKAIPYAERASTDPQASIAERHAIHAHEALGNWEESEAHVRRQAQSNPDLHAEWFWWCVRTDRGGLEAARTLAREYVLVQPPGDWQRPVFHLLDGDRDEAIRRFREAASHDADPWLRLHLAILLHEAGEVDEALAELDRQRQVNPLQFRREDRRAMLHLARTFYFALTQRNAHPPSVERIDELAAELDRDMKVNVYHVAAELYAMAGEDSSAMEMRRRCVTRRPVFNVNQTIAYYRMRQQGIEPYELLEE